MVRFERVPHPQQRPERGTGKDFEHWHNEVPDILPLNLLAIAIGGALGSAARYLLSTLVLRVSGTLFPLGTFVVNIIGCVVFGAIAGATSQRVQMSSTLRLFLLTGILGGFTTFSSYAFESFALIRDGQFAWAALNVVGQVVAGLAGLWAGYVISA
jgi:CrcB protein